MINDKTVIVALMLLTLLTIGTLFKIKSPLFFPAIGLLVLLTALLRLQSKPEPQTNPNDNIVFLDEL
jgi:hypothetical protein